MNRVDSWPAFSIHRLHICFNWWTSCLILNLFVCSIWILLYSTTVLFFYKKNMKLLDFHCPDIFKSILTPSTIKENILITKALLTASWTVTTMAFIVIEQKPNKFKLGTSFQLVALLETRTGKYKVQEKQIIYTQKAVAFNFKTYSEQRCVTLKIFSSNINIRRW